MRIAELETFQVPPRWIFVRVRTDDGLQGWGEAIVPKRVRAVRGAVDDLADVVRGAEAGRIEDLWQRMHKGAFFRGGPILATAAAAIEQALWDIKGRHYGAAVYDLLGGPVRESLSTYAWVGGDRPADVVEQTRRRVEQGFQAVKMHVAGQLDHLEPRSAVDAVIERVGSLRDAFGSDLGIAVDFSGRAHLTLARTLVAELAAFHPMWVEEPVAPECDESLPELARVAAGVPIATGERLTSRFEFKRLIAIGGVDILQPDVSLTGVFELEKICRMAEAYDLAVAPHAPNGPVSLAASLQVAFCCGNVVTHEQSEGIHYHHGYAGLPPGTAADYLVDVAPLTIEHGSFARPRGPGLGIDINGGAVAERAVEWHLADPEWRYEDGRLAEW